MLTVGDKSALLLELCSKLVGVELLEEGEVFAQLYLFESSEAFVLLYLVGVLVVVALLGTELLDTAPITHFFVRDLGFFLVVGSHA